ncbi:MAG: ubiquinol-cytochrome reductase [Homoserinimonas sp.]|jgi:ubiquinol-cytochrome c reductase iron-sulfur subunit|nr:ubiquinol-cytochrome reductase [Homoserinimonas sp.]
MAQHDNGDLTAAAGSAIEKSEPLQVSSGTAVVSADAIANPGLPPHRERVTDIDPAKERQAARRVSTLFLLSILGSVFAVVAYIIFPIVPGDPGSVRLNTLFLGLGITLGLIPLGIGAIYWAKHLMRGDEITEQRHSTRGTEATRAKAVEVFRLGNEESGFGRRTLIRNTLIGALAVTPLPAIALFRDLAPAEDPVKLYKTTLWEKGTRLARDPSGTPIRAADVTLGSVFHVIPEGLHDVEGVLEEKAKAAVLLMRLKPEDLNELPERADWSYQGIVAYSKICTHVGCPVALYEQHTHHLLCPCHQSTFDVTNHCEVIFGPAKRPLPQLPIAVDSEGYLVAQSDFLEPVGPSFWERSA